MASPQGQALCRMVGVPGEENWQGAKLVTEALSREYAEELGVKVKKATPWFVFERELSPTPTCVYISAAFLLTRGGPASTP